MYQTLSLINVWWSKYDINTRFFNSVVEQHSYFDKLTDGKISPSVNFNFRDNIKTTTAYRDGSNRSIKELLSCNYMVVKSYIDENDNDPDYRFYFADVMCDNSGQVVATLELDDIQTNYFRYKHTINDCVINRAHLDRFIKRDNKFYFNNNLNSNLFVSEDVREAQKLPIERGKLKLKIADNEAVDNWLYDNVEAWVYIFLDTNPKYILLLPTENLPSANKTLNGGFFGYGINNNIMATGYIAYPIYKKNKVIISRCQGQDTIIDVKGYKYIHNGENIGFINLNNNTSYFYSIKVSNLPPQKLKNATINIDNNGNLIIETALIKPTSDDGGYATSNIFNGINFITTSILPIGEAFTKYGLVFGGLTNITTTYETYPININIFNGFNKDKLKENRDVNFNPKTYNNNFRQLKIYANGSESFYYSLQAIGYNDLIFEYTEALMPEVTKFYLRLKPSSGLYNDLMSKNYTGLVGSQDNSLAFANDQYSNFIANNKNFWLQASNADIIAATQSTIGNVGKITSGISSNGGIANAVRLGIGLISKQIDRNLTIDNLSSAPSSIKNSNGNALFNQSVDEFGLYYEIDEAIPSDIKIFDDMCYERGFAYGHQGEIGNFDNIRKYFNYIEADANNINAPISNEERRRLSDKLKAIRFWNIDSPQFNDKENYERYLDE